MAKTLVVLNPIAGMGRAEQLWLSIETALRDGGLAFDLACTNAPRHATVIAEKAKREGYETIVVVGGDGTVHEVVNGLMRASNGEPSGTLGVIPVGSGNDFLKMLPQPSSPGARGPQLDWREGVRRLRAGTAHWVDVGRVIGDQPAPGFDPGAHYFVNGLDTGFGALVAMRAHETPFLQGTAMYLAAVFKTLVNYFVPRLRIELADGQVIEQRSTMTVAAIGRCMGGGFWLTPDAQADDGLLDIMIAEGLGRIGILSLLPKVMNGTHVGDPRVKFIRSPRVVIASPDPLAVECDGEIPYVEAHRLEIEALPKRLGVIA